MKMLARAALLLLAFVAAAPAAAQIVVLPQVKNAGGANVPSQGSVLIGSDGVEKGTVGNPIVVTGGAGGGGGTATVENQAIQITAEQLLGTILGGVTASPTQYTIGDRLKTLNNTMGSLFQNGGSIGNTVFGATQSGTWTIQPGNTANTTPWLFKADAGENHVGSVGGLTAVTGGSFTRPANTTAYAANQLFANSTTAGSVVPVTITACRVNQGHGTFVRASLSSSNPLAYNIQFRVHLFKTSPTTSVGDGGTWSGSVNIVAAIERGTIDITLADKGSDGAKGFGAPNVGNVIAYDCAAASTSMYALIEVLGAYTPLSGETETLALESIQD